MTIRGIAHPAASSSELLSKLAFLTLALPALVRAAVRVHWHGRRLDPRRLPTRLRRTPLFRYALLQRPDRLATFAAILVRLIPSRRRHSCVEHSLLLLDLWSRCGLEPRIHYGVRLSPTDRAAHAWVSTDELPSGPAGSSLGCEPIWSG